MKTQNLKTSFKTLKVCLLIVAMGFVVGCSKDEDEPKNANVSIVGTWYMCESQGLSSIITFNSNNTFNFIRPDGSGLTTGKYEVEYNVDVVEIEGIMYNVCMLTWIYDADSSVETDGFLFGNDDSGDFIIFEHMNKLRRYNPCG